MQPCKTCRHRDRTQIEQRVGGGVAISQVAREFQLNRRALERHVHNHGVPRPAVTRNAPRSYYPPTSLHAWVPPERPEPALTPEVEALGEEEMRLFHLVDAGEATAEQAARYDVVRLAIDAWGESAPA